MTSRTIRPPLFAAAVATSATRSPHRRRRPPRWRRRGRLDRWRAKTPPRAGRSRSTVDAHARADVDAGIDRADAVANADAMTLAVGEARGGCDGSESTLHASDVVARSQQKNLKLTAVGIMTKNRDCLPVRTRSGRRRWTSRSPISANHSRHGFPLEGIPANASNRRITPDVARASPYRRAAQGVRVVHADSRPSCTRARCRRGAACGARVLLRGRQAEEAFHHLASGSSSSAPPPAPLGVAPRRSAARRAFPSVPGREREDATPATAVPEDTVRAFDRYFGDADAGRRTARRTASSLRRQPRRRGRRGVLRRRHRGRRARGEPRPVPRHRLRRARAVPLRPRARRSQESQAQGGQGQGRGDVALLDPKELKRRFQEKRAARVRKRVEARDRGGGAGQATRSSARRRRSRRLRRRRTRASIGGGVGADATRRK